MKLLLLAKLGEGNTRCTPVDENPSGTSTELRPSDKDEPAAKRCSLLFAVHNEILKESIEKGHQLASPSAIQVQNYLSEVPIDRSQDPLPTGGSMKIISLILLYLPMPISLPHAQALKASACLALLEMSLMIKEVTCQ